jgi:Cu-Zn family superoxide dismutase
MSFRFIVLAAALALYGASFAELAAAQGQGQGRSTAVSAAFVDASGQTIGAAEFSETNEGVIVTASLQPVPSGRYVMRVHVNGVCEGPDFASAGAPFNPFDRAADRLNPLASPAGGASNISVGTDGAVRAATLLRDVTLRPGPASLNRRSGTSLIVAERAAQGDGRRIACAVISAGG